MCMIYTYVCSYSPSNEHSHWKMVVGRRFSFWERLFSGSMLVLGRVHYITLSWLGAPTKPKVPARAPAANAMVTSNSQQVEKCCELSVLCRQAKQYPEGKGINEKPKTVRCKHILGKRPCISMSSFCIVRVISRMSYRSASAGRFPASWRETYLVSKYHNHFTYRP